MKNFWKQGEHYVWYTGAALAVTIFFVVAMLWVVITRGMGMYWPSEVTQVKLKSGYNVMGEVVTYEEKKDGSYSYQIKVGNRDLYGSDFRWINDKNVTGQSYPDKALVLERKENGNFYGYIKKLVTPSLEVTGSTPFEKLVSAWNLAHEEHAKAEVLEQDLARLDYLIKQTDLAVDKEKYYGAEDNAPEIAELRKEKEKYIVEKREVAENLAKILAPLLKNHVLMEDSNGREKKVILFHIVRLYQPNIMSFGGKCGYYMTRLGELLWSNPRESNTEGGLFPAIFGTVMLIFIMSFLSFPLGVVAGVYLKEYAKEGFLVRMVRVAVNNLAGVPSIVFGIFGLGFFIYGVGGTIDQVFYAHRLPTPTFGTGGILWASLTLGLLTVPVVIVATEEALGTIPDGIRQGSLALGATKYQTLKRVLLPMASPGIMTGFILAMARAAGEVAPLMLTGVIKIAPSLPIDGNFPFFHLDRKFMHLGFHIYDLGFQSPNAEAARPMVFVTTMLLLLIVLSMSSIAIYLRNKLKKRYSVRSI